MGRTPTLLDQFGNPVQRAALARPITHPRTGSVQAPMPMYPGDGLNPVKLAQIMRAADIGEPMQYLALAEQIEERDPHYLAVISTRKRSVSQIEITVEEASDSPEDAARAELVRDWLKRDGLNNEIFHILDCLGKGFSITEIEWAKSMGQWWPQKLALRDPRGFRFDRNNLTVPVELDRFGNEQPLEAFRYIYANIQAKSGLPLRGGLARTAAWGWMFKAYTQRDWAIYTQTYGQPLRLGRYGPNATPKDQKTLFQAVANIAGDCAAIIPEGMNIEFIETSNVGATSDLYLKRADWLDQQISKAVLGQTATTDAVTGGLGSGKEHREVQEDIETADAKSLEEILNNQLIQPWMRLEYGNLAKFPRLVIARTEPEDLKLLSDALGTLVPIGLKVAAKDIRERFTLPEPKDGEEILQIAPTGPVQPASTPQVGDQSAAQSAIKYPFNTRQGISGVDGAHLALMASEGENIEGLEITALAEQLAAQSQEHVGTMIEQLETMLEASSDLGEFQQMILNGFDKIDAGGLAQTFEQGMMAAHSAGRLSEIADPDA